MLKVRFYFVLTIIFLSASGQAADLGPEQLCGLARHWVKEHFRKAYTRADGKHFKATTVRAHCSDNPPGYSFWRQKIKDGRPSQWPGHSEVVKPWTDAELERILEALGFLPAQMQREDIAGIFRMVKSVLDPNPASGDIRGDIAVYDKAFDGSNNLSQILAHEIAHRIFLSLSKSDARDYRFAAGWINRSFDEKNPDYILLRQKMVDPDSANSVEEDFANNVEFYLFKPLILKDDAPGAYNWISRHFGGNFKLGKGSI